MKMKDFVAKLLAQFQSIKVNSGNNRNAFVVLESEHASAELHHLLATLSASEEEIKSEEDLQPFYDFLEQRWQIISNSPASYTANPNTIANLYCSELNRQLELVANRIMFRKRNLLMPNNHATVVSLNAQNNLQRHVLEILKQEADLPVEQQVYTTLLQNINAGSRQFANILLSNMQHFVKDRVNNTDLTVYLESKHAAAKLKTMLEQARDLNQPMSADVLKPFIDFLKERWDLIDGTPASYTASNSYANRICNWMAGEIALSGYQINYLKRDHQQLMMPVPHHNLDQAKACDNLQLQLARDLANSDAMIDEMLSLPLSKWKAYVSAIESNEYQRLITNNAPVIDCLRQHDMFSADEARNKAVLFSLFEMYIKERSKYGYTYKSALAYVMPTMLCKTPTADEKIQASNAVQDFLLSGASLDSFNAELNDPQSALYAHKLALEDARGILRAYLAQIDVAVAAEQEQLEMPQRLGNV